MSNYVTIRKFYDELLEVLERRYPRLLEDKIGMVKILHVFEGKVPLIDALLAKNLLAAVVLKKSSSDLQRPIVDRIKYAVKEKEIRLHRSETTYARALPELRRVNASRPFIIGDHGGYYAHLLPAIARRFGDQFRGATEHTLNGEIRHSEHVGRPFMSTARLDLKSRSDRNIAQSIAQEVRAMVLKATGNDINGVHLNLRVLMIGYGVMGSHAAQYMKAHGCQSELVVHDISAKKTCFAVQDGHTVSTDIDDILPTCDVVILATDVIMGQRPVLSRRQLSMLKDGVCVTSMTSMDDEIRQQKRIEDGTLKRIGAEGDAAIYENAKGGRMTFLLDGRPANVRLPHGGGGDAIHMVEAAGLAGAFAIAQNPDRKGITQRLSDDDSEIISSLWLKHFASIDAAPRVSA